MKWEQVVSGTMLLQQQLQEVRGEIKPSIPGDARPAAAVPKRVTRGLSTSNGSIDSEVQAAMPQQYPHLAPPSQTPMTQSAPLRSLETRHQGENSTSVSPLPGSKSTNPLPPPVSTSVAYAVPVVPHVNGIESSLKSNPNSSPVDRVDQNSVLVSTPLAGKPSYNQATESAVSPPPQSRPVEQVQTQTIPVPVESHELARTAFPSQASIVEVPSKQPESTTVIQSDEDVVIFEQMRYQLQTWLRIEAIHAGLEISGQTPGQLLDALKRQDGFDDTRLQVVSTLLNIANQVIARGNASLIDYKQAMMFYLMHTRHSR
jgi:hypothetical protein